MAYSRSDVDALLPLPLATFHILIALAQEDRHGRHDDYRLVDLIRAADTVKLPINSVAGLHSASAQLVREGKRFSRVLWMTHGSPGSIVLGNGSPPKLSKEKPFSERDMKGYSLSRPRCIFQDAM